MKKRFSFRHLGSLLLLLALFISITTLTNKKVQYDPSKDSLKFEGETHLRNIKQLTFGGNNAEAYWSFDDKQLIFQSDWNKINSQGCDQIYIMNADGSQLASGSQYDLVSTGKGRTTCSYFLKDGRIIYASTHEASESCPESVMFAEGRYVWPIYSSYNVYVADKDGSNQKLLIGSESYDAEATASPDGRYVIFTSTRSGDLDLWRYDLQTGEYLQLTNELGYDGGAFFSRDSKQIVWRASRPQSEDAESYIKLLAQGLVEPKALNIFVADIDGKNVKQVTDLSGANWAPFFHPDGKKVLFCSNHHSIEQGGRLFDIFMINIDGTGLKQITHSGTFDAFPMFSFDGKKLVFCSNRNKERKPTRDTNVFVADWVDSPEEN
jgi:Tol biopolymer transport system component